MHIARNRIFGHASLSPIINYPNHSVRKTIFDTPIRCTHFEWKTVLFPKPLYTDVDCIYTVDEDTGRFTVVLWQSVDGGLYPRVRQATLASICETSLNTIDTLLEVVKEASMRESHPSSPNEASMQCLLKAFSIKSGIPAQLNELQSQIFTDFVSYGGSPTGEIVWFYRYLIMLCPD